MLKIEKIPLLQLRNAAWYQLFTELRGLVEKYGINKLDIAEIYSQQLAPLLADADTAMADVRDNPTTARMEEADQRRDELFRSMVDAVRAHTRHFDLYKRKAARRVINVLERFGTIARRTPTEATADIRELEMELDSLADDIQLLAIDDWVDELKTRDANYCALVDKRNSEYIDHALIRIVDVRRQVGTIYKFLVERLEALAEVYGENDYMEFFDEWNRCVTRFKMSLESMKK